MDFTDYDTRLAAYAVIVDESERILLSWYNGAGRSEPGWTLPGGGVEYAESVEDAVIREVREETGYDVALDGPLAVQSFVADDGPRPPRPYKSVRIIYAARIVGGRLGTLEVGGTTDRAAWMPLRDVWEGDSLSDFFRVAIASWRQRVAAAATVPRAASRGDDETYPFVRQVVLDCPHARALAEFYRELLGYSYRPGDEPPPAGEPDPVGNDWLVLRPDADDPSSGRGMAFQQTESYVPPTWSAGAETPRTGTQAQMSHLDMTVADADSLTRQRDRAVALGATILFDRSDDPDEPLYVFADPAGHPFCIFVA